MPRSRRIPHLEYRKSGYVWRRRLPRSLTCREAESNRAHRAESEAESPQKCLSDSPKIQFRSCRPKASDAPQDAENLRNILNFGHFSEDSNLRKSANRNFLLLSLKTHGYAAARELAERLTSLATLAFHYASIDMTLTASQVSDILTTLARFEIEAADRIRALEDQRTPEAADFALRRERALQNTLREALLLRNREVARLPLQHVAEQLGIELPEDGEDWKLLAYEATRVLLNLSEERERRERGLFTGPSPYFTQAIASQPVDATPVSLGAGSMGGISMAPTPSTIQDPHMNLSPSAIWQGASAFFRAAPSEQPASESLPEPISEPEIIVEAAGKPAAPKPAAESCSKKNDPLAIAAKRIQLKNCKPETIKALKKGNKITPEEGYDVYIDLKSQGYGDDWEKRQVPIADAGMRWIKSTLPALNTGKKIWVDLLGNTTLGKLREEDVVAGISDIKNIPRLHGKSAALSPNKGYRDLVERVPFIEQKQMNDAELELKRKGVTDQVEIEMARQKKAIPSLRNQTFFKHVRSGNRVGKMLLALGIISENPFACCTFTKEEEKRYKLGEAKMARQRWDDRADDLFATPVFHGEARDEGDPLFWSPLLGFLQGLRGEEGLQLGPDDFGKQDGIDYMRIHNGPGNSVKSEAGERVLPVHPALIELGLIDLVELRRKQGKRRLFSNLRRGQTKETFTEIFTKEFTRYRQSHKVYWHGLDLHATRTTFHHDLMDLSTPGYIQRKLMGHEPLDEGERSYAQNGISLATLHEHVSRIRFNAAAIQSPIRKGKKSGTQKRAQELGLRAI